MKCPKCGALLRRIVNEPLGAVYVCIDCNYEEEIAY